MLRLASVLAMSAALAIASDAEVVATHNLDLMPSAELAQILALGIELEQGQAVRFSVSGNPTTGYSWNLNEAADHDDVFSVSMSYETDVPPEGGEFWTGIGGTYYWTVEAGDEAGEGVFHIWHGQKWSGAERAIYQFEIPIHVV